MKSLESKIYDIYPHPRFDNSGIHYPRPIPGQLKDSSVKPSFFIEYGFFAVPNYISQV